MHVHKFTSNYSYTSILVQVRGIGTDIAIVSCMVFLAQVKLHIYLVGRMVPYAFACVEI